MILYEKYIDHTLLSPTVTGVKFEKFINDALTYNFYSVCVNPNMVGLASEMLVGSDVKVCSVVGFPFGANKTVVKVYEAQQAVADGAVELDYVIDLSAAADDDWGKVEKEAQIIVSENPNIVVKAIIETALHSLEQVSELTKAVTAGGVDFVKTCSGVNGGSATLEAVEVMRKAGARKVKASGGIKTASRLSDFITVGVNRVGTSNGVNIMKQYRMEDIIVEEETDY